MRKDDTPQSHYMEVDIGARWECLSESPKDKSVKCPIVPERATGEVYCGSERCNPNEREEVMKQLRQLWLGMIVAAGIAGVATFAPSASAGAIVHIDIGVPVAPN